MHLLQKNIPGDIVADALTSINQQEYEEFVCLTIEKKYSSLHETDVYKAKGKLFQFAASRGFEPDIIYRVLDRLIT